MKKKRKESPLIQTTLQKREKKLMRIISNVVPPWKESILLPIYMQKILLKTIFGPEIRHMMTLCIIASVQALYLLRQR